jgi:uncharacterized protein
MTAPGGVPSPCINVCRIHAGSGLCEGCLRTLDEITVWSRLGDEAKHAVWAELPARRVAWLQRLGGAPASPKP